MENMSVPLRSMVIMHTPANVGFAIAPLETLFASLLLELAGGDPDKVHFAYPRLTEDRPRTLPAGVRFVQHRNRADGVSPRDFLAAYAREHGIDLVLLFDAQPVSPLYRDLRSAGVRCLLTYWGAEISSRSSWWKLLLKRLEVSLSRSRLDGLIFESQAMADLARFGRGVPDEMIDVVPLGVDISRFTPGRTSYVYDAFSIDSRKKVIVYAGHMEARKGVASLVRAGVELIARRGRTDVAVLIFGDRPGEADVFRPLLEGHGVDGDIIFAGYRSDLHLCFPGCFAGVIPSVGWDSFPRTAVELAACGLPLVVSRLGGLPECVVEGRTGLVFAPGDHVELAGHLTTLLDDPERARTMGVAGRMRCEQEFTLDVQYKRIQRVLEARIRSSRRARREA